MSGNSPAIAFAMLGLYIFADHEKRDVPLEYSTEQVRSAKSIQAATATAQASLADMGDFLNRLR